MKIILSLVLIVVGIFGLVLEYKRRAKEKKEIMQRVVANHLIAKDALAKLSSVGVISGEDFFDAMEHLTDNSIEIILKSCGTNYIEESDWLIKGYENGKAKEDKV